MYRRALEPVVGARVDAVDLRDPTLVDAPDLPALLTGERLTGLRRHGKLLLVDTTGPTLGVRFGMTGQLVVDGNAPIEQLAYGTATQVSSDGGRWDRLVVTLRVSGRRRRVVVRLSDPRRFGRVLVDPVGVRLGPDVWTCTLEEVADALAGRAAPVKAVLLDQARLAGLGNMLADELLWRAGVGPWRRAGSLTAGEVAALHGNLVPMLDELFRRGGSHAGDLSVELRRPGGQCAIDGADLSRRSIGGRTAWWCPEHQH